MDAATTSDSGAFADPAAIAACAVHEAAVSRLEADARREAVRYAAVTCSCRAWFSWDERGVPPQAGCGVHGNLVITPQGEIL